MLQLKKLPYVMKNTSSHPQEEGELEKPDMCLYKMTPLAKRAYMRGLQGRLDEDGGDDAEYGQATSRATATAEGNVARTAWAWIVATIEVKVKPEAAPFNFFDDKPLIERNTDLARDTRAQIIGYATRIQRNQHRTYVPMVFIQNDSARLILWDRSGAIVSKVFRYTTWPRALLDFVYCLAKGGREAQGCDPTVTLAEGSDFTKLERYQPSHEWPDAARAYLLAAKKDIRGDKDKDRIFHPTWRVRF